MGLFGTSRWEGFENGMLSGETCMAGERCELSGSIYPVGIDPLWHVTDNKITFFNSLKMKISIVVGVFQMTLGICISLLNHLEYRDYKKVLFQFIPEIIFFQVKIDMYIFIFIYSLQEGPLPVHPRYHLLPGEDIYIYMCVCLCKHIY